MKRLLAVALALGALCHLSLSQISTPSAGSPVRKAILDAARPMIEREIGMPVLFNVSLLRVYGDYAFVNVKPEQKNGKAINWGKSKLHVTKDDPLFHPDWTLLLKRNGKAWKVIEHDDCYTSDDQWPDVQKKYGLPRDLFKSFM